MDLNPADVSKGVDGYAFICGAGLSVDFSRETDWGRGTQTNTVSPAPGATSTMQSLNWEIAERGHKPYRAHRNVLVGRETGRKPMSDDPKQQNLGDLPAVRSRSFHPARRVLLEREP